MPNSRPPCAVSWTGCRDERRRIGFDPAAVAAFDAARVAQLLADPGIVRNRLKVASTVSNAGAVLALYERGETLADLLWSGVDGTPRRNAWVSPPWSPGRDGEWLAPWQPRAPDERGAGLAPISRSLR